MIVTCQATIATLLTSLRDTLSDLSCILCSVNVLIFLLYNCNESVSQLCYSGLHVFFAIWLV